MLVLVSLDPRHPRDGHLDLDLAPFGRRPDETLDVVDVLSGAAAVVWPGDRIDARSGAEPGHAPVPAVAHGDSAAMTIDAEPARSTGAMDTLARDARDAPSADPLWYKDAIIYEVHVRAFFDSDATASATSRA